MKWVVTIGVAVVFGMLVLVAKTTADVNGKLDIIAAREPQKEKQMTSDTTTWKSAYGMKSLTTYKGANETNEQWAARTLAEVRAMQVTFPIIP